MHKTRTAARVNAATHDFGLPTAIRTASMLGAVMLAVLPATALAQSPNIGNLRIAEPVIPVQPSLRQLNPTQTLNTTVLRPLVPSTARIAPTLAPSTNPEIRTTGVAPLSAAATGLGRLVAPGNQNASAVVALIGSTTLADVPSLTADFDGDGLINFEIAPGIVEIPTETTEPGATALGGLVGQHITMATGTADRVLDGVINTAGVTPATTFEITDGTVVLGGYQPQDVALQIDVPTPDGPVSQDPSGPEGRNPDRPTGQPGDDHATRDPVGSDPLKPGEICLSHGCYGGDPVDPKPGTAPDFSDFFNFSGFRTPPAPDLNQSAGMDDLLNVSIMLPLRGRERQADQFSNYGNEEIW